MDQSASPHNLGDQASTGDERRKRPKEAIQETEPQLDNLLANVGVIVLEGDPFDIYYVGGQVENILGYPKQLWFEDPDGAVGFWSKHLHPDDTDKIETCRRAIALGNDHAFEYRMIAADGGEVWFYDTVTVETEHGKPVKTRSVMVDITNRKRAEEALRRSEERLDLAVRGTSDGLWDSGLDSGMEYWSPRYKRMLGYGEFEIEATHDQFLALLHPEDRADVLAAIRLHLEENRPFDHEFRMQSKSGKYLWFQSRGEALRDSDDKPYRMAGSIRDVTDRRQAEEALRTIVESSSHKYGESFFESIALELARALQADYTFIGELCQTEKECVRTIAAVADGKLVDQIEYDLADTPSEKVAQKEVCSFRSNVTAQFPKDTLLNKMEVEGYVGVPLSNSVGETLGFIVAMSRAPLVNTDFAESILRVFSARVGSEIERNRTEDALHASEEQFRLMFETSPLGMALCEMDGMIVQANQAYLNIIGYSHEEALKLSYWDVTPNEYAEHETAQLRSMETTGRYGPYEKEYKRKNGVRIPVLLNGMVVKGADGVERIWSIVEDITDRKRADGERRQLEAQLHQSQKMEAIGQLAAGLAHDFNNLLTVILCNSEVLISALGKQAATPSKELQRSGLELIRTAGKRAASLTQQLLTFGRRENTNPEALDLKEVVGNMKLMLRRLIGKHIQLDVRLSAGTCSIHADRNQIEQVIMNLVLNATDAMPDGGRIEIQVETAEFEPPLRAEFSDAKAGPHVLLCVTDTGTGMTPDTLEHVFEPFFTTKPLGKGTGLGLATVYGTVKQLGGCISVDSKPGVGSTFGVYIPIIEQQQTEDRHDDEPAR